MEYQDRKKLNSLLIELMSAQDDVTHMNEKGIEHQAETRALIAVRNGIKNQILLFVEGLTQQEPNAPHRGDPADDAALAAIVGYDGPFY